MVAFAQLSLVCVASGLLTFGKARLLRQQSHLNHTAGYGRNCIAHRRGHRSIGDFKASALTGRARVWLELPPAPLVERQPKLALLMFVNDSIANPSVWMSWMDHARQGGLNFTMLIHASGVDDKNPFKNPEFLPYLVQEKAHTAWCDIWEAEMLLVNRSLMDPDVTHLMVVSHDSVPVKSLRQIHKELRDDPLSRLCQDASWYQPRAESWWLLRRGDAELFRDHQDIVKGEFVGYCTEEHAWFWPLKMRMMRWGGKAAIVNECPMFTEWKLGVGCKAWADHADLCKCPLLTSSKNITPADNGHPASFHEVGLAEFKELLASPFWFARKFPEGSISVGEMLYGDL